MTALTFVLAVFAGTVATPIAMGVVAVARRKRWGRGIFKIRNWCRYE